MTLDEIICITGRQGLFKIINRKEPKILVESLVDGKKSMVHTTQNGISILSKISIYTTVSQVSLATVFSEIYDKEKGAKTISHKSNQQSLITLFEEVLPEYDRERVYTSNIKKIVQWYNILVDKNFDFKRLNE